MRRVVGLALVLIWLGSAAQAAERRVALVVGASQYRSVPTLRNTLNDARGVAAALKRMSFDVETVLDPDRAAFEAGLRRFGGSARGADVALFFYAGHALEAGGHNWLLPVSADARSTHDLSFEAIDLDLVLEQADGARLSVVMLDSCRDNPFRARFGEEGRGIDRGGLAPLQAAAGTLVVFSTAPGTVAADGSGPNSPFTTALLRHLEEPGVEVRQMLAEVRRDVRQATGGKQVPWEQSAMDGSLTLKPGPGSVSGSVPGPGPGPGAGPAPGVAVAGTSATSAEELFWDSVRNTTNPAELQAYLDRYPTGIFVDLARARLAAIARPRPLADRLADELPEATRQGREEQARRYVDTRRSKALAISVQGKASWRTGDWATAAFAAEHALEACQVFVGQPCVLLAVDDEVQAKQPDGSRAPRDMPRVRYSGLFDPMQIPAFPESRRQSPAITGYAAAPAPKAIAFHPWGRAFVVTGAASEAAAQAQALASCRDDPDRKGADGPCFLYAAGNQVVLPQRRTEPIAR